MPENRNEVIQEEWERLDQNIRQATQEYKQQHKDNPKIQIPQLAILDDLREFNTRRKELALSNAKSPAITASILTAQSSYRRLPKIHPSFSLGVGRARKIRAQADLCSNSELWSNHNTYLLRNIRRCWTTKSYIRPYWPGRAGSKKAGEVRTFVDCSDLNVMTEFLCFLGT